MVSLIKSVLYIYESDFIEIWMFPCLYQSKEILANKEYGYKK